MVRCRFATFLVGLLLIPALGVFGQQGKEKDEPDPKSKEGREEAKIKALLPKNWSRLGLSDSQKKEVYRTRARYQDQINRLQDQLNRLREQIDALHAEERAELHKVLTPGQRARLFELLTGEKPKDGPGQKDDKKPADKEVKP